MASQAEIIRGNLRDNQERESQRQVAATDFSGRAPDPELANGIPSTSNDEALAAHLKETRDKSEEYARLRTEEAREQWSALATANYQKQKAIEAGLKDQAAVEAMNRGLRERRDGLKALNEWGALTKSVDPSKTEWEIDLSQLRDIANTQQRVIDTTGIDPLNFQPGNTPAEVHPQEAVPNTEHPRTFPDGSLYQLKNLSDGKMEVQLVTGERFVGDPVTVTSRMAEAQVRTKLWARGKRPGEELPDFQSQPAEPMHENLGQEFTPSGSLADDLAARQRESVARSFGFSSAEEMIQDYQSSKQVAEEAKAVIAQYRDERLALEFTSRCPDFPCTPEASNALVNIVEANGWDYDTNSLQAAHLLAVKNHVYQPVSEEALQAVNGNAPQANRPTAPPMLRSNNPEITSAAQSPYDLPLHELRKLAIRQELDNRGPNYR